MELVLVLSTFTCLIFAISVAIDKATKFITALKDSGSAKMRNGFKASLSIVPIDKKVKNVPLTQPPQTKLLNKGFGSYSFYYIL